MSTNVRVETKLFIEYTGIMKNLAVGVVSWSRPYRARLQASCMIASTRACHWRASPCGPAQRPDAPSRSGPAPLPDADTVEGPTSGMRVVRPLEGEQDIQRSPFGEWSVSCEEGIWRARHPRHADFAARGHGRWRWFAFESRRGSDLLWVSDEAGLRAWTLAD